MKCALTESTTTSRLLGVVLAFELGKDMATGGMWILTDNSLTGRIAHLSTYPTVLAVVWILLSVLVVPYLLMQVFFVYESWRAFITRVACRAILASGVIWCYLGYLSKNLDYEYVTHIFMMNGIACVAMAALLANGLNTAQRKEQESKI